MATTLPPPPSTANIPSDVYKWMYLAYTAINSLQTSGGSSGTFGSPGVNTPGDALVPNQTRSIDYLNLSTLSLGSTEVLASAAELNQIYNSNITRADLNSLNTFSNNGHNATFQVGTEAANIISVALQFFDAGGAMLAVPYNGELYLSDDPQGLGYTAVPPDTSVAAGVEGHITDVNTAAGSKILFNFTTNTSGRLDVDITNTTAATWFLVAILPYGKVLVSDAITFA